MVGAYAFDDADPNFTKESSATFSDSVSCDPAGIAVVSVFVVIVFFSRATPLEFGQNSRLTP